jgi:hypothetical protein
LTRNSIIPDIQMPAKMRAFNLNLVKGCHMVFFIANKFVFVSCMARYGCANNRAN